MPTTKAVVMVIERENGVGVMVDSLRKRGVPYHKEPAKQ